MLGAAKIVLQEVFQKEKMHFPKKKLVVKNIGI